MGKFIHLFDTQAEFETAYHGSKYKEPWVSYVKATGNVKYNKNEEERKIGTPLTFDITGNGNIVWKYKGDSQTSRTIEYSKNGGEWTSITSTTSGVLIPVSAGDTLQFRGNNKSYCDEHRDYCGSMFSGSTADFNVRGNIMSLINSDSFGAIKALESGYTFTNLFESCTVVHDASHLLLPATALTSNAYAGMFRNCSNLYAAPSSLPATILAEHCYDCMFINCYNLATAPSVLPATTLAQECYANMFANCGNYFTTAPELPAETLVNGCYNWMFANCGKLNYIKCLATDISATNCTSYWVGNWDGTIGVASTGTFVKSIDMLNWTEGTYGIPPNWVIMDA